MSQLRSLSIQERALIDALLAAKPEAKHLIGHLDDLAIIPMKDGGMGSLLLVPKGLGDASRQLGQRLVLGEFTDADGVPVSVALNVDKQGQLYELDLWKVNFARLVRLPDPTDLRIIEE